MENKTVHLKLPKLYIEKCKEIGEKEMRSMANVVRMAVKVYLKLKKKI